MKIALSSLSVAVILLTSHGIAFANHVSVVAAEDTVATQPLYRNGGHFGPANSDQAIEDGQLNGSISPSEKDTDSTASAGNTYSGTRYRNGGYFGDKSSDDALERTEPH